VYQLADMPAIPVRGILDRVEFGEGSGVVVFDYKTGKPKSRNEIEGATKSSNGEYKRQLLFYHLLLSLYERGKWRMETGVIDFIEPDQKGRFHQERFSIESEEVTQLKETIDVVAHEIFDLAFWESRCGEKDCDYCRLRDFLPSAKSSKGKAPSKSKRLPKK
jgi:DNA helicase-2/ATP-dependent DNA helicase PcrA